MKLKSLRIACNCMDYDLANSNDSPIYDKIREAKKDIEGCIKVVEKQVADLKKADIVDALGTCLCFQILVDFLDRGYLKRDDPLNPYLRAEKIEKEVS